VNEVAREGQHSDWLVKAFSKETPSSTMTERNSGIFWTEA
jgi:hypothetical protein